MNEGYSEWVTKSTPRFPGGVAEIRKNSLFFDRGYVESAGYAVAKQ
jgi:hypothetical protein